MHTLAFAQRAVGVVVFCLLMPWINVSGAVPGSMTYQGYLTDPGGSPVDANVPVTFNLYNVESGGVALWSETLTVAVAQGLFSIDLGAAPGNLFRMNLFDTPLFLGLAVDPDPEMTPRRPAAA